MNGPDGGTGSDCALTPALTVFSTRCATSAGCHSAGGQFPELTSAALPTWVNQPSKTAGNEPLVVPGSPEMSWIYKKVSGTQGAGGGALMPLGAAMPISESAAIRDWIAAGAPTQCGSDVPPTQLPVDPNSLDQSALFACAANAPPASSVARIRRIDRPEWAHAIGAPAEATGGWPQLTAQQNPFTNQTGAPYSTYSAGATLDTATLDLYFLNVSEAGWAWDAQFAYRRLLPVLNDTALRCIFNDARPTDACIDHYVDRFLTLGVLARTPTADERARYRGYLVAAIAREPGGGDVTARKATLDEAGSAAWLTAGALFRSELGAAVMGDPAGRRRLTNEELALALGSVLNTHRPGAPLLNTYTPSAPDDVTPANGWLQLIRAAADNGTIQDPAVLRSLIAKYAGGIDATRRDLLYDSGGDTREVPARGEYWLAPRIAGFFREWLAYGSANSAFKDTPGATSRFPTTSGQFDATTLSYTNLQNRYYGSDSTLVDQLDDTIARAVIDSAMSGTRVFPALLTTRLWRLPSDLSQTNAQTCKVSVGCRNSDGMA